MNAVRNNWKRCVRCRLLQCSHFLMPCKYCIAKTPAVSCRLGIPHNSKTSTLTENLSQDQIVTGAWSSLPWTDPVIDWFQIQQFVLFYLRKQSWMKFTRAACVLFPPCVFSVFFTHDFHKEEGKGKSKESRLLLQVVAVVWSAADGGPQGVLTRTNNKLRPPFAGS